MKEVALSSAFAIWIGRDRFRIVCAVPPHDSVQLPSRARRIAVILGYSAIAFAGTIVGPASFVSGDCYDLDVCTTAEILVAELTGYVWLGTQFVLIVLGWRGKLPGARARPAHTPTRREGAGSNGVYLATWLSGYPATEEPPCTLSQQQ